MLKVLLFSILLLLGLLGSQWLPLQFGAEYAVFGDIIRVLTMIGLSFIMIRVGYEFDIDKNNLKQYGWDYFVAFTAASFPWIFVSSYFVFVLLPPDFWSSFDAWKETLLAGRFAAPTSAGVLFSMLAAAGLSATWLFKKARILAIFDDLDTVLLMIPLKALMVGLVWQLGIIVVIMAVLIFLGYRYLHKLNLPAQWPWVLFYSIAIALVSEALYAYSKVIDESVPIHIEVLLPAFILGCVIAYPINPKTKVQDPHWVVEQTTEKKVTTWVAAIFMVLVGLSMPLVIPADVDIKQEVIYQEYEPTLHASGNPQAEQAAAAIGEKESLGMITASQPSLSWAEIAMHVLLITIISNLGKMFPAFCYRREAHWRERLAVAVGMFPRGEVGAGVLVLSISYGIGGPIVTIAMLSLVLNLILTGVFIFIVKRLTRDIPGYQ